ncbi:tRNA glutamyl-Q(34) synthetase GluQRS [Oleiagrimonas sp. C23AA]|uniref:tRNA glutamyl-Q(34) synthetase GluQRS n=1 Tax=Oleiagrimonas sp. C23AA TaxID=2719047 RepID=UPI0014217F68|nr:tRNA glutamyl-Q(34) synthetase GluQRS [Oleiagrimonas sp. C23AA]NII10265.1 tRNA glutamyl-Q(34) synthetase GluQRS [Oleiagrimonas sp. C23AA]
MSYRGRFAPSPTGHLHAGSLLAALASYLDARHAGGAWLLRVEDIDPPREAPGSAAAILQALGALGLHADAPVLYQSQRHAAYQAALDTLIAKDLAFPCWCSRSDLAPHGGIHRDGHCVRQRDGSRQPAWRLRVPDVTVEFVDRLQGPQREDLRQTVGDFVLKRADGFWAYQLACVVDDAAQGITDVVRGRDLLDSTARQIFLQRCLALPTPRYLHLPLLTDTTGRKLSKSQGDALGQAPPHTQLVTALHLLGQTVPEPAACVDTLLAQAVANFDASALPTNDRRLAATLAPVPRHASSS